MCLWDLIEKPETSRAAEVISNISIIFVVISTVGMVMATMPELEPQYPKLALIEAVCISWFTIEYLLRFVDTKIFRIEKYFPRFAGSPQKCDFVKGAMNIIDVLAILPYYLDLFMSAGGDKIQEQKNMINDENFANQETNQKCRLTWISRGLVAAARWWRRRRAGSPTSRG